MCRWRWWVLHSCRPNLQQWCLFMCWWLPRIYWWNEHLWRLNTNWAFVNCFCDVLFGDYSFYWLWIIMSHVLLTHIRYWWMCVWFMAIEKITEHQHIVWQPRRLYQHLCCTGGYVNNDLFSINSTLAACVGSLISFSFPISNIDRPNEKS